MNKPGRTILQLLIISMLIVGDSNSITAHVKWFVEFDSTQPPLSIGKVLTKQFIYFFIASVLSIYFFFALDRYVYHRINLDKYYQFLTRFKKTPDYLMRLSAGAFFISIGTYGLTNMTFLLTPELKTQLGFIPYFQFLIGLCALTVFTTPLIGVGIICLYIIAAFNYGIYHLVDYTIFLGIAWFFLISRTDNRNWKRSGLIILFIATAITLYWASMEKFAYPQWAYPILEEKPNLLFGLSPYYFMLISGFMEFNIAFMVFSSASLLARAFALAVQGVFVLAIVEFGIVDALGHSMIIAILLVLILRGPTRARNILVLENKTIWMEAYFMTGLYITAFVVFAIAYYGLHFIYY